MRAHTRAILFLIATLGGCTGDDPSMEQPVMPAAGSAGTATAGTGVVAGAGTGGAAGTGSAAGTGGAAGAAGSAAGRGGSPAAGTSGGSTAGAGGSGGAAGAAAGAPAAGAPAAGSGGTAGAQGTAGTDPLPPLPLDKALPIVFVHGYAGSAQQYQSQAMRFVANGYPPERIRAYEHDGLGSGPFVDGLDDVIDGVLAEFKTEKVFLVGHSRGTFVSSSYLGNAQQAAKVAKYIAIDGSPCVSNVPCVAPNQQMFSGQKHVEVCTSKESFAMQYEFLMGEKPKVVDIVRQRAPVEIRGRAVNFPANTGRAGTTLKIYSLDAATGARSQPDPIGTFQIAADGNWGPVTVDPEKYYEMELAADSGVITHFYSQPILRSTDFVRLLSGPPDSPSRMNTNTSDKHAALVVSRQREWLASDVIEITTKAQGMDQPAINAMTPAAGMALGIGIHIHDDKATPGQSTKAALPYFSMQAFQYGVDVFMPASDPATGVITIKNLPRGDMSKPQVLNVPNWASSKHFISIGFSDFPL